MWFDVLILGILLVTTIRGAVKGVVWQLAAIASLVLCFVFAQSGSLAIAPMIPLKPPANRWTAMFIIYLVSSLVAFGTARFLREGIEKAKFTEYDKHLGAIFGFVKGAVISLVLIFFVVTVSDGLRDKLTNTYSGRAAAIVMDHLHDVLPPDLLEQLEPYIHRLDRPDFDLRYGDDHDGHDHGYARDDRRDDPFYDPNDIRDPGRREPIDRRDDPFSRPRGNDPFDRPEARSSDPRSTSPRDDDFPPRRDERRDDRLGRDREPDFFNPPPRGDGRRAEEQGGEIDIVGEIRKKLSGALESEVEDRIRKALRNTAPEDQGELNDLLSRALPSKLSTIADEWRYGRPEDRRRETEPRAPLSRDSRDSLPRDSRDSFPRSPRDPVARDPDSRDPLPRDGRDPLPRSSRDSIARDPGPRDSFDREPISRQPLEPGLTDRDGGRNDRADRSRLLTEIVEFYSDEKESRDEDRKDFEEHLDGLPERVAIAVLRDWHHDLSATDRDNDPDPETHFNTKLDIRILNQLKAARVPITSLNDDLQDRLRDSERR